jgi:hypothetical protein
MMLPLAGRPKVKRHKWGEAQIDGELQTCVDARA